MTDFDDDDFDEIRLDLSDAEEQSFTPLPAGPYPAVLESVESGISKTSKKPQLTWTWKIAGKNRKVWSYSPLSFGDTDKAKNGKPKGKLFKDNFLTLLVNLTDDEGNAIFQKSDVQGNIVLGDILSQIEQTNVKCILVLGVDGDNNKVNRVKKYDPSLDVADDDEDMPV